MSQIPDYQTLRAAFQPLVFAGIPLRQLAAATASRSPGVDCEPRSNTLRWVDITGETLNKLRWPDKFVHTVQPGRPASGRAFAKSAASGSDGIWLWSENKLPRPPARQHQGKLMTVDDCTADPQGRLLRGTIFLADSDTDATGLLYALTTTSAAVSEAFNLTTSGYEPQGNISDQLVLFDVGIPDKPERCCQFRNTSSPKEPILTHAPA